MNPIATLLKQSQSVFTFDEIRLFWNESDSDRLKSRLSYYARKGDLLRLRRGIYSTTEDYPPLELAGRILTPSYISFETCLVREAVIFQYHAEMTVASYCSRTMTCDGHEIRFRKIKDSVLTNPMGVNFREEPPVVSIASPERALVDLLYCQGKRSLDNPDVIDWDRVIQIATLVNNKRVEKDVKEYADRYTKA